jgi:copper(I)-binding protein
MKATLALASLSLAATLASAHVSLDPPRVEAGTTYRGVLRIGHGCDAQPTTALEVRLPDGGTRTFAVKDQREFPIEFAAPAQPGPLWLKVLQRCGATTMNWADVPASGKSTEGMKTPALLLQVVSAQDAAAYAVQPAVEGGWVRATVPGQVATGAFMRITAKEPTQLVRASTPAARSAEVHEMKMEGDVMRMRPAGTIELAPGRPFELKPSGYHLMLQDLKKPLENGSTVPVTLVFRSAKGVETQMDLKLPVALQPPTGGMGMDHKH